MKKIQLFQVRFFAHISFATNEPNSSGIYDTLLIIDVSQRITIHDISLFLFPAIAILFPDRSITIDTISVNEVGYGTIKEDVVIHGRVIGLKKLDTDIIEPETEEVYVREPLPFRYPDTTLMNFRREQLIQI